MTTQPLPSRRAVLSSAGIAAITLCLAGCTTAGNPSSSASASSGPITVKTSEIPVGGGKIVGTFVVTQPVAGTFDAFSYFCTHQGFPVEGVTNGVIVCAHHGSKYSIKDGSVVNGPATRALAKATATVNGDTITVS